MLEVDDLLPVQEALLGGLRADGRLDARVEASDAVLLVDLDGEFQGGCADGLALDPADLLEDEDGVLVVGKGLVLHVRCFSNAGIGFVVVSSTTPSLPLAYLNVEQLLRMGEVARGMSLSKTKLTNEYFPLRFFNVISAGAAMSERAGVELVGERRRFSGWQDFDNLESCRSGR